jgi:hypothetical protein
MVSFRLYFLDATEHVTTPAVVAEYPTPDDAVDAAREALRESGFSAVEVWYGPKLVSRITRRGLAQ